MATTGSGRPIHEHELSPAAASDLSGNARPRQSRPVGAGARPTQRGTSRPAQLRLLGVLLSLGSGVEEGGQVGLVGQVALAHQGEHLSSITGLLRKLEVLSQLQVAKIESARMLLRLAFSLLYGLVEGAGSPEGDALLQESGAVAISEDASNGVPVHWGIMQRATASRVPERACRD